MKKIAIGLVLVVVALAAVSYLFPESVLVALRDLERGSAGLEQKSVTAAGHEWAYLEGGAGNSKGEPMLLLHGFGADKDHWTRLTQKFDQPFHIIAPDLPGFGDSSFNPAESYDVGRQVERIRAFVVAVNLQRPFILGGNSMGGNIAGAYAARYPADVKGLILLDAAGVSTAKVSELRAIIKETGENPLVARNVEEFERLIDMNFVNPPFIPSAIKNYLTERAIAAQEQNAKIFGDYVREPVALEPLASVLTMPVMVIWGENDRILHVSGAQILGEKIPGSRIVIMKQTGHLPMIERPAETARAFSLFVSSLGGGAK